jgi:anaerobic selenocysteine-containing dehydrogenase
MTATVNAQTTVTVHGACPHDCPDTCAMLVSVRDGRAVAVRGDPEHPFTRGGLCVKVNNYVDKTYSPDRVLYPMRLAQERQGRLHRQRRQSARLRRPGQRPDLLRYQGRGRAGRRSRG